MNTHQLGPTDLMRCIVLHITIRNRRFDAVATNDNQTVAFNFAFHATFSDVGKKLRRSALVLRQDSANEVSHRFEGSARSVQKRVCLKDMDLKVRL